MVVEPVPVSASSVNPTRWFYVSLGVAFLVKAGEKQKNATRNVLLMKPYRLLARGNDQTSRRDFVARQNFCQFRVAVINLPALDLINFAFRSVPRRQAELINIIERNERDRLRSRRPATKYS